MPDILHMIDIHATRERAFAAVATTEGIARWWSTDVEGGDVVGDRVTVRFGGEWKVVMERTELAANERVSYRIVEHNSDEWPGTDIVFALAPDIEASGDCWTHLRFDHRGWRATSDFYRFCSAN